MANNIPSTPEVLDAIKNFVKEHKLLVMENQAVITLYDAVEYTLESVPNPEPGTVPHIGMWNEMRSISFQNVDELRGWLRCHSSFTRIVR